MEKFPLTSLFHLIITSLLQNHYLMPVLWFAAGVLFLSIVLQTILFYLNIHKNLTITTMQFPVIDKDDIERAIEQMAAIFSSLHGNVLSPLDKLFIEILKVDKYITIQIGSNKQAILEACKRMFSQLEGVRFSENRDALTKLTKWKARSMYSSKDFLPIGRSNFFYDGLINYLSSLPDARQAGIQFILRGVEKKFFIERRIILIENKIKQEKRRISPTEQYVLEGYQQKLSGNLFRAKINIFGTTSHEVKTLKSFFQSLNLQKNNWYSYPLRFFFMLKCRVIAAESFFDFIPVLREMNGSYLTSTELAVMMHPSHTLPARYMPEQNKKLDATPDYMEEQEDNIPIGASLTEERKTIFFPLINFARHVYILGKTGSGKSTLLISLITNLAERRAGSIFVFDPHGDLIQDILPRTSLETVVYLPLSAETNRIFTFNLFFMFKKTEYEKVAIRDMLLDILKSETDEDSAASTTGTATINRIKIAIEILLEFPDAYFSYLTTVKKLTQKKAESIVKERQLTLNDLPYLFIKEMKYVDLLQEVFSIQHTELSRYINKSMDNHVNQVPVVEAVQARLKQLLHPSIALICEGNTFDFDKAIQSNKTFLFPIPEDIYGSRGQRALLKMFLSLLWQHKRKIPTADRINTYVFIDEVQRAQIPIIPTIIAEARKYKFYLTLANQQLGQLTAEIRDAIAGNMGTIIAFKLGAGKIGAELIAQVFGKRVQEEDLLNLPAYSAYLQTEDENHNTLARFTFQTLKLEEKEFSAKQEEKLAESSLQEYGEDKTEIRERLNKKQENPLKYFTDGI